MFEAIKLLDFSQEVMIHEVMFINRILPGAFSFKDLKGLYFKEYELILEEVKKIAKEKPIGRR